AGGALGEGASDAGEDGVWRGDAGTGGSVSGDAGGYAAGVFAVVDVEGGDVGGGGGRGGAGVPDSWEEGPGDFVSAGGGGGGGGGRGGGGGGWGCRVSGLMGGRAG